ALPYFLPVLPDTEISFANIDVVEEHHAAVAQLRQPCLEVVAHSVVGVESIDVQGVDRLVGKVGQRFVECRSNQPGEAAEMTIVKRRPLGEDLIAVKAGMLIALPGIDRVAGSIDAECLDRLGKCAVAQPRVRAELDQRARSQSIDEPKCEGNMTGPTRRPREPRRAREDDSAEEPRLEWCRNQHFHKLEYTCARAGCGLYGRRITWRTARNYFGCCCDVSHRWNEPVQIGEPVEPDRVHGDRAIIRVGVAWRRESILTSDSGAATLNAGVLSSRRSLQKRARRAWRSHRPIGHPLLRRTANSVAVL